MVAVGVEAMSSRSILVLAILVATLALPGASALGEEVFGAVDATHAFVSGTVAHAYHDAVAPLVWDETPQEEAARERQQSTYSSGDGRDAPHEHDAPSAQGEEEQAAQPGFVPSVSSLVPIPVTELGPAPKLDLAYLTSQVHDLSPLAPAQAPAAAPRVAAPAGPAPVGAAAAEPVASAAIVISPVAVAITAAAATAATTGSAAATVWERARRFLWLGLLYSRIAKERLLDHGSRERLLATIRATPGLAVADIAERTGLPRNTVTYHLRVLERERLVSSTRNGRNRLFFAPGSIEKRDQADALATLRHETTLAMARAIGETPGVDQKQLCARVGVSPSLAHWHADRLVASGVVDKRREGRSVRYYPGAAFGAVSARAA